MRDKADALTPGRKLPETLSAEMSCEFVDNFTRPLRTLSQSRPVSPKPAFSQQGQNISSTQWLLVLHGLLVKSHGLFKTDDVRDCINQLRQITTTYRDTDASFVGEEEGELEKAVVGQLTVALYANALDKRLAQASQVEAEAEWWADVEGSTLATLLYLLQSMYLNFHSCLLVSLTGFSMQALPMRIGDVARKMTDALRARHLPISLSTLSASSLLAIFSAPGVTLRPSLLTSTLFPHLQNQQDLLLAVLLPLVDSNPPDIPGTIGSVHKSVVSSFNIITILVNLPIELTRQECRYKRRSLQKIRDQRAEVIGRLAQLHTPLRELMHSSWLSIGIKFNRSQSEYPPFLDILRRVISSKSSSTSDASAPSSHLDFLDKISQSLLVLDTSTWNKIDFCVH